MTWPLFSLFIYTSLIFSSLARAETVNCDEAYENSQGQTCEVISCPDKYKSFIGTWTGPMERIVDFGFPPKYEKYTNTISYSENNCLYNSETKETFIIGRQVDELENGQKELKLLITGSREDTAKDGTITQTPFLRTVDLLTKEIQPYGLAYKNDIAIISVWSFSGVDEKDRPFTVETIDSKDWTVENPDEIHRRNVTVTLKSSSKDGVFERVLVRGYHTKLKQ